VIINIILPNEKPRNFYKLAAEEYLKRLQRYCRPHIETGAHVHMTNALRVGVGAVGKILTSENFAAQIKTWEQTDFMPRVLFCIAESANTDQVMALSSHVLPWDLWAVMLLEQIYRAYRIILGQTYHK
jgi:23S rRNA pseudoU1915 N3-methylase RlmH